MQNEQREYPRWAHHFGGESRVIQDAQREADLGPGWGDYPGGVPLVELPVAEAPAESDEKPEKKTRNKKA